MYNRNQFIVLLTLAVLLIPLPIKATDKLPLVYNPHLFREQLIRIEPKTIDSWLNTDHGNVIALPWFEESKLHVTVEQIDRSDKYNTISGKVEAEFMGSVVLTQAKGVLTGAIIIDTELYRLRSMAGGVYSLVEINQRNLPEYDDVSFDSNTRLPVTKYKNHDKKLKKQTTDNIIRQLIKYEASKDEYVIVENGSRVDILIAYTTEAANWAQRNGLDIQAEISNMMDLTNKSLGYSGVQTLLNKVGTVEIDHTVLDPSLHTDVDELAQGFDQKFLDLRLLQSQLKADLVSLLVLNGEQGCTVDNGFYCGRARLPTEFMTPEDLGPQGYLFGRNGYSVVSIYNAFNNYTFMHEIGHNLGAHHDKYAHTIYNETPTVDEFARGWLMFNVKKRTLMAYNDLCAEVGYYCDKIPFFSNPLNIYFGSTNGHPAPGETSHLLGPANNVSAMNRMKQTVANYKRNFGS